VAAFLERHRACAKARPWAGRWSSLADAWDNCPVPDWLIWARKLKGPQSVGTQASEQLAGIPLMNEVRPSQRQPDESASGAMLWRPKW
jgi:hypothetical protein